MKLRYIQTCPKCLIDRPFIHDQREMKPGEELEADCRGCSARIQVIHGRNATIVQQSNDKQRKLFD